MRTARPSIDRSHSLIKRRQGEARGRVALGLRDRIHNGQTNRGFKTVRKLHLAAAAAAMLVTAPAFAQKQIAPSSGRKDQVQGTGEIPMCTRNLGAIAIVEPENQWWRELNLGSPEAIIRIFVQRSGCFTLVNRGRSMQGRAMERAMADQGELQQGSNLARVRSRPPTIFSSRTSFRQTRIREAAELVRALAARLAECLAGPEA